MIDTRHLSMPKRHANKEEKHPKSQNSSLIPQLLPLARPPLRNPLILLHPVVLLNLMLPQIVRPVLVLAHAPGERTLVDDRRRRAVLQLAVLGHAALEPLRVAAGAVAADVAARVRLDDLDGFLG